MAKRHPIAAAALLALLVGADPSRALADEGLSSLQTVGVAPDEERVTITIEGTRAPDFTSFVMEDPFRVVVDWAGSRLAEDAGTRTFERGLVRRVQTKQFNSEAEKISRVVIELAQRTTYRVEAAGTKVHVHLDAVPDPLPAPEPEPEPVEAAPEADVDVAEVPVPVVDGPLTEPDVPIPAAPPPLPTEAVAEAPPPAPEAPVPVVDDEPAAVLAVVEPPAATPEPDVAPEPPAPEPEAAPAPEAEPAPEALPVPAPVLADAEPEPEPEEPMRLATFEPSPAPEPETEPERVEVEPAAEVPMTAPPAAPAAPTKAPTTSRIADAAPPPEPAEAPASEPWAPPGVGPRRGGKALPVVKIAKPAQEPLTPEASTPADPSLAAAAAPAGDADDFDPGPRVMKYIGFRQMAGTSRVFMRLDGKTRYRQFRDGSTLVIVLIGASVPVKNNTRPLDTSYFDSPVSRVKATPKGDDTRVEITLRERGEINVKRIGTTIAVDFTRPRQ